MEQTKNMTFVTYNTVCCLQVVIVILLEKYASLGVAVLLPDMGVVSEKMQILCPHTEKSRRFLESQNISLRQRKLQCKLIT